MRRIAASTALFCVFSLWAIAAKKASEYADLSFTVLNAESGQPIRNAAVVLHEVDNKGREARGGIELKTNAEGKTSFAGVRYGTMRIQVIASGFQTFGQDFAIDQPQQDFTIRLKRPVSQYSIYDK